MTPLRFPSIRCYCTLLFTALLAAALPLFSCGCNNGGDGSCTIGSRDCACTPGGGCDPGLTCNSGVCRGTTPPPGDGGPMPSSTVRPR